MKSVFWTFAFLFSLVLLAAAYYVTRPGMRTMVDARAPWVRSYLQPYIRESSVSERPAPRPIADDEVPEPQPAISTSATQRPPVASPEVAPPEPFDLKKLAANRAGWPARVALAKATEFPAVVEGKVVGALTAPAGTEVEVVTISGGKIGVEYQGGGAWLFVEETDVVARTQKK